MCGKPARNVILYKCDEGIKPKMLSYEAVTCELVTKMLFKAEMNYKFVF
jgi:hypothetical protein